MPLMGLAATAIDQPQPRARVIEHVSKYLHTDSACCRYEPGELADRQASVFDPILARLQQQLGWQLSTSEDITGAPQSRETTAAVQAWLQGLDSWNLAAVDQLTTTSKSLVLAAALAHHMLSAEEALAAARLEERYQVEQWGSVEAGHDLDELETRTRIVAPTLLMNLLRVGGRGGTIDEQQ